MCPILKIAKSSKSLHPTVLGGPTTVLCWDWPKPPPIELPSAPDGPGGPGGPAGPLSHGRYLTMVHLVFRISNFIIEICLSKITR